MTSVNKRLGEVPTDCFFHFQKTLYRVIFKNHEHDTTICRPIGFRSAIDGQAVQDSKLPDEIFSNATVVHILFF